MGSRDRRSDFFGWFTTCAYFITAAAALLAMRSPKLLPYPRRNRYKQFWFLILVVLLLLGSNKQLDLQNLLTAVGRCSAWLNGWYDQRRHVQLEFIIALLGCAAIFEAGPTPYHFRGIMRDCWLAGACRYCFFNSFCLCSRWPILSYGCVHVNWEWNRRAFRTVRDSFGTSVPDQIQQPGYGLPGLRRLSSP